MVLIGLIRNVGTSGNRENIKLIENLAAGYISKPNCIILMTITCESMLSFLVSILSCLQKRQRTLLTKVHMSLLGLMIHKDFALLVCHFTFCIFEYVFTCTRCANQAG